MKGFIGRILGVAGSRADKLKGQFRVARCPVCHGRPRLLYHPLRGTYYVEGCYIGLSRRTYETPEEAVKAWNAMIEEHSPDLENEVIFRHRQQFDPTKNAPGTPSPELVAAFREWSTMEKAKEIAEREFREIWAKKREEAMRKYRDALFGKGKSYEVSYASEVPVEDDHNEISLPCVDAAGRAVWPHKVGSERPWEKE